MNPLDIRVQAMRKIVLRGMAEDQLTLKMIMIAHENVRGAELLSRF